jgi:hypothetical protein
MRPIWIIAWHGFVQHATSRPFLLGVMLPLFYLLLVGWVPNASQSQLALLGAPVRHFAVVDGTGRDDPGHRRGHRARQARPGDVHPQ